MIGCLRTSVPMQATNQYAIITFYFEFENNSGFITSRTGLWPIFTVETLYNTVFGVTCWEGAELLAFLYVIFYCVFVTFPCGVLGRVWCSIVSIPDLCLLSYFNRDGLCFKWN